MRKLLPLVTLLAVVGCGVNPGKNPDPVDITGKVTMGGKPVSDVVFNLQPTSGGLQAMMPVINGEVKAKVTPGKYTWFITEGRRPAALKAVSKQYWLGSMDRQVDIAAGTTLDIKLD